MELCTVTAAQKERWRSWLSPERRKAIEAMAEEEAHLCGEGLAREMLSSWLDLPPEQLVFTTNAHGKPLVEGAWFSISHSGGWVGCAVSHRPIGLDLEYLRPVPQRMGQRFGTDDPQIFFRLWTAMEARIKCCGATVLHWQEFLDDPIGCTTRPLEAPQGCVASICVRNQ